jgi:hypothetical protein
MTMRSISGTRMRIFIPRLAPLAFPTPRICPFVNQHLPCRSCESGASWMTVSAQAYPPPKRPSPDDCVSVAAHPCYTNDSCVGMYPISTIASLPLHQRANLTQVLPRDRILSPPLHRLGLETYRSHRLSTRFRFRQQAPPWVHWRKGRSRSGYGTRWRKSSFGTRGASCWVL